MQAATSIPEFSTTIIPTGSGAEQRIGNWLDARVTFNAAMGVRSRQDLQVLSSFFRARKGRLRGFLVKDLLDYQAAGDVIAVAAGQTVFQLQRVYTDAVITTEYGNTGNTDNRPIFKPVRGTIQIYNGITLLGEGGTGAAVSFTIVGGVITGVTITAGGGSYTASPFLSIGGDGTGATVSTSISGGTLNGVTITNGGSGYTKAVGSFYNVDRDYGIDYRTGKVYFGVPPTNGSVLNWSGQFYIPCRFVDDRLPADEVFYDLIENKAAGNIPDVSVIEVRDFE